MEPMSAVKRVQADQEKPIVRLVRVGEVRVITGLSRSQIYELESRGNFPRRVPIGQRVTCWALPEIEAWVAERIAARDQVTAERSAVGQRLVRSRQLKA